MEEVSVLIGKSQSGDKEAREVLELADSTTKRILKEMVEDDILVVKGERKTRKYLLKNHSNL